VSIITLKFLALLIATHISAKIGFDTQYVNVNKAELENTYSHSEILHIDAQ